MVHESTIRRCKDVLDSKGLTWKEVYRDQLKESIRDVDFVITIGGDGTLLQASHFLDSSIPVLGVNSDPTQWTEVKEKHEDYDATRSTGYLCAATKDTFEHVLEEVLARKRKPSLLPRISACLNGELITTYALNDVLLAHPNPAAVTRCTFRICKTENLKHVSPLVHVQSSGLRICTGLGSTAAMHSAGGFIMSPSSAELQYMVREPIAPNQSFMHTFLGADELLQVKFNGRRGVIYFDGSHIHHDVDFGDVIEFSSQAPQLQLFLRHKECQGQENFV
ncbi:hypothetical protein KP509_12G042300 [Ceratopteris richardii]|nr:hypothetical protein KP509_12G042300 [Ceratopteris richardii]KAH7423165.1 hypothetical protein KP509_12G042300 [Ceratopteris richardii]